MSFETWWAQYEKDSDGIMYFVDATEAAWNAGRAESEAQIAALQSDLTKAVRLAADYGIERDALRLERDALRDALLPFKPSDENVFAYMELAHPDKPRKYPITVTDRDLLRVHSLLSTPASGEPARKP